MIVRFSRIINLVVIIFFRRQNQSGLSGKSGTKRIGRNKGKMVEGGKVKTNFKDVAGIEEAKGESQEIGDFLMLKMVLVS